MTSTAVREPLLLIGLLSTVSGCQYLSGASDLEIVDSNTGQPNWACRGQSPSSDLNATVTYAQPVRDLADESIIEDVTVRACISSDESCAEPVVETTPTGGVVSFSLAASFFGFISLDSPTMMPTIVELTRPIGQMRVLPELRMVNPETFATFTSLTHNTPDPAMGHAQFWIYDCDGKRARDVSIRVIDPLPDTAHQYYVLKTKLPSAAADRTDESGAAGFVNLPTGILTFQAYNAADDSQISLFSARIRAGQITCGAIEPD